MANVNRPYKSTVYKENKGRSTGEAGFSPMLSALLSYTIKDGFVGSTAFALLRDISPYVSADDRRQIERLLRINDSASYIACPQKSTHTFRDSGVRAPLCGTDKFLGLLRVLMRYGGRNTRQAFEPVINAINMQCRLKNIGNNPMGILGELMPQNIKNITSGMGDISSMLNMLNLMNK